MTTLSSDTQPAAEQVLIADLRLLQAQPFAVFLAGTFYLDIDSIHDATRKRNSLKLHSAAKRA